MGIEKERKKKTSEYYTLSINGTRSKNGSIKLQSTYERTLQYCTQYSNMQ